MLYRSNLLALVGGGRSPRHSPSKVILFDEKTSCIQCELEFRSRVRRVLLRKDRYCHPHFILIFCPAG